MQRRRSGARWLAALLYVVRGREALAAFLRGSQPQVAPAAAPSSASGPDGLHGAISPFGRTLLVTSVFPGDKLPVDVMLAHQLRMIQGPGTGAIRRVVVLDNRPPWMPKSTPQEDALARIKGTGKVEIQPVDYRRLADPDFLKRFFTFSLRPESAPPVRISDLLNVTKRECGPHGCVESKGTQLASNFLGMATYWDLCLGADPEIDLCIYLDPDVFLHRKGAHGLANLAPGIFARNPQWFTLMPPVTCSRKGLDGDTGTCDAMSHDFTSSRYMILNRTRLAAQLPIDAGPPGLLGYFEGTMIRSHKGKYTGYHDWFGLMDCGDETFAIHPGSRHTALFLTEPLMDIADQADLVALYGEPSDQDHPRHNATVSLAARAPFTFSSARVEGTRLMTMRVEAGQFERVGSGHNCQDMQPSAGRMKAGLAW